MKEITDLRDIPKDYLFRAWSLKVDDEIPEYLDEDYDYLFIGPKIKILLKKVKKLDKPEKLVYNVRK